MSANVEPYDPAIVAADSALEAALATFRAALLAHADAGRAWRTERRATRVPRTTAAVLRAADDADLSSIGGANQREGFELTLALPKGWQS